MRLVGRPASPPRNMRYALSWVHDEIATQAACSSCRLVEWGPNWIGADDRKGDVQLHPCSALGFDQILSRCLEEIHGRLVLEGRRVRQIDDDLRTFERFGKAFASDRVDGGIGCRCKSLMPELRQLAHDL